jgi:hypothetical protein
MEGTEKQARNINFVAEPEDHELLRRVRERLHLTASEVARRALRLGLKRLERANLPGNLDEQAQ